MTPAEDESFTDGIVEIKSYDAELPAVKEFLPWHLPRKQFVRERQWCAQILQMIAATPPDDATLKYLGLPGVDLLDLRHFHSAICLEKNIKLRFLGFNSSIKAAQADSAELNVSLDEVRRLSNVDPMSSMLGDNFSLVANRKSLAHQQAYSLGPYDVINLDLCDGFGAAAPGRLTDNYYNAVSSLLALQAHSKNPWLLFLTTRTDVPNVDAVVLESLVQKYITNLSTCVSFRDASRDRFAIDNEAHLRAAISTSSGLLSVFLTGLSKWFAGLALAYQPPITVELKSVIGYRVVRNAEHSDLVSLALKFSPTFIAPVDPLGLAQEPRPIPPDECAISTQALQRVSRLVDADKILRDDADLNRKMTESAAALLELARYDVEAYRLWLPTQGI